MEPKKEKLESPISKIGKKKIEQYEELLNEFDKLHEYLKPIVGEDNEEINKLLSSIRIKLIGLPLIDMIQTTLQSSMGVFMAGKEFNKHEEEFNKMFEENKENKDFYDFMKLNRKDFKKREAKE